MNLKKWVVGTPDRELAKQLSIECDIDPFAALIACQRGYNDPSQIEQLITDEVLFEDPAELIDIKLAADVVNGAIADKKKIAVFGDYDCDGVTATAIMLSYLRERGADAVYYIPDRIAEGYGMNKSAVDKLKKMGVELIITVDNGISCAEEINYAASLGISTVVTDHHLPPEELPGAAAVVNPHRKDCPSAFKEVCGAMVAFKLVCVIADKEPEELISKYADLLSVATIGDVMPLISENRSIVKCGIAKMKRNCCVGIGALMGVSGVEKGSMSAGKISYAIVPRINAAGRMGSADKALELLLSDNMLEALKIANFLDEQNAQRQNTEKQILAEAIEKIEAFGYQHDRVIVVSGSNWNLGVVGIVAARITERYGKPSFVISFEDGEAHGSGRSISGFSLYDAMNNCSEHLTKFGGHELAGGISLLEEKIEDFRKAINAYAKTLEFTPPVLNLDCRINPAGMSLEMAEAIKLLEPFGNANPAPVFGVFNVTLSRITPIGNGKHLKLLFTKEKNAFQALLFGVSADRFCFNVGDELDLAVVLETNFFRDEYSLSVQIKALRLSATDDEAAFKSICLYDDFKSGSLEDVSLICPDRNEIASVYRSILEGAFLHDRISYLALKNDSLGYAKTEIAIEVLKELGLIREENGILSAKKGAPKTDLMNSSLYKQLMEGGRSDE